MRFPLGIYIHIPFCQSKCGYCNFASGVYPDSVVLPYLTALHAEILGVRGLLQELKTSSALLDLAEVDSVYFGGGTPSLIDASHIAGLMQLLNEAFLLAENVEVTLEVNPGSVTLVKVHEHLAAGVNRVSIGMQTFQDDILKRIGRSHSVQDSFDTISIYRRAGIENASLDLIAGLPGQTLKHWQENLDHVEVLSPDHISMYLLELHENTPFGKTYGQSGGLGPEVDLEDATPAALPDDEQVTDFYTRAVHRFGELGYRQYEISNFARRGKQSRHNLKYWNGQPFIGFGCGAYSDFDGKRWGNERSVGGYVKSIQQRQHAIDYRCEVSLVERQEEAIFLGLRLTDGIWFPEFRQRFGFDLQDKYWRPMAYLREAGLIESTPERLRLTPRGFLLSNEVFTELLR
ncbi:MAG TPA: radical SAM family heme chaperone HemW [Terriglobia bacterium]|nr:radical SAM family heme chaperone HemW [Terriglobia bacterium]